MSGLPNVSGDVVVRNVRTMEKLWRRIEASVEEGVEFEETRSVQEEEAAAYLVRIGLKEAESRGLRLIPKSGAKVAKEYWKRRGRSAGEEALKHSGVKRAWHEAEAAAAGTLAKEATSRSALAARAGYALATRPRGRGGLPLRYSYATWKSNGIPSQTIHVNEASTSRSGGFWGASEKVGPIPTTANAVFEGRTHRRVGARKQKFTQPVARILRHAQEYDNEGLSEYCDPAALMVQGAWDTNREDLVRHTANIGGSAGISTVFKSLRRVDKLNIKCIPALPGRDGIESVLIRPDADPGYLGRGLGNTRGQAVKALEPHLADAFEELGRTLYVDTAPFTCGGRERRNLRPLEGEDLRSRLVLGCDTLTTCIGGYYGQAVTRMVAMGRGEVRLGLDQETRWYQEYMRNTHNTAWSRSIDISRSDQTLSRPLIVAAFGLIRSYLPPSKEIDNHFGFIMSSFIYKRVVTPGGYVYRIGPNGVPSGHPFTSLVTSFAHWVAAQDGHRCLGLDGGDYFMEQSGDDARYHYRNPRQMPDPERWAEVLKVRWGLMVKPASCVDGKVLAGTPGCCPELLAMKWIGGIPGRDRNRIWDISLLPRYPKQDSVAQGMRLYYMRSNNPMDLDLWKYHWHYFWEVGQEMPDYARPGWARDPDAFSWMESEAFCSALVHGATAWRDPRVHERKEYWATDRVPLRKLPDRRARKERAVAAMRGAGPPTRFGEHLKGVWRNAVRCEGSGRNTRVTLYEVLSGQDGGFRPTLTDSASSSSSPSEGEVSVGSMGSEPGSDGQGDEGGVCARMCRWVSWFRREPAGIDARQGGRGAGVASRRTGS